MQCSTHFLITLFLAWGTVSTSTTAAPPTTAAGVGIDESLHAPAAPVDTAEKESIRVWQLNSVGEDGNKDEYSLRNRNVEYIPQESMSPFQIELDLNSEVNGPTRDKQDVNTPTFFFLNVVGLIVGLVVVAFLFYKAVISAAQVEEEKVATTTTTEVQTDIEAAIK
mmetsp:Transcript_30846/g.35002  ORF Transcript_30846/g.35002 Transcript_30846/m.35002 type:complete len:166 (+) Transcript_30846:285-782(+)